MSDVTHLNQMYIHSREQFLILESRFPAGADTSLMAPPGLPVVGYPATGASGAKGVCHGIVAYPLNTQLDTTPISDFTFIFNIIFVIMCFVLGPRLPPFPIPFNICRCASRQLAAAALAVVSLNFQPSLSSPSPFHNSFCHTIITSILIATVFVVDVVVCVNK